MSDRHDRKITEGYKTSNGHRVFAGENEVAASQKSLFPS